MATPDKKIALTIKQLTPQERGICDEALHHGVAELQEIIKDLTRLPADFSRSEALLLLTLLGQLPPATQLQVKGLMDQLRAAAFPNEGGTVIHFPPP